MISVSADDVVELERLVRSGKTEQRVDRERDRSAGGDVAPDGDRLA